MRSLAQSFLPSSYLMLDGSRPKTRSTTRLPIGCIESASVSAFDDTCAELPSSFAGVTSHPWSMEEIVGLLRCGTVRYRRPRCEECVRLANEGKAVYLEYLSAKDDLTMTARNDSGYLKKRQQLEKAKGLLRESLRRERSHESTHQDEFS